MAKPRECGETSELRVLKGVLPLLETLRADMRCLADDVAGLRLNRSEAPGSITPRLNETSETLLAKLAQVQARGDMLAAEVVKLRASKDSDIKSLLEVVRGDIHHLTDDISE